MQKTGLWATTGRLAIVTIAAGILIMAARAWQPAFAAGDGTADGSLSWRGIVNDKPASGLTGDWVIAGKAFTADGATEFNQEDGLLAVGVCADVDYVLDGNVNRALEIDSKEAVECNEDATVTPDPNDTPGATETPDATGTPDATETPEPSATPPDDNGNGDDQETIGVVTALTDGLITVGNNAYVINGATEIDEGHGQIEVGACVKVEYRIEGQQRIAEEIESKSEHHCNFVDPDNGTDAQGEFYGVIESIPAGLIGTWQISGMSIEANAQTEFDQEEGAFAVGVHVKVEFVTSGNQNLAREIDTEFEGEHGSDDDGNGRVDGAEGQAFGTVDAFPQSAPGLIGPWTIGGVTYATNADTEFETEDGAFAVGAQVKVRFFELSDGTLVADKIATTHDHGETEGEDHSKFVGFVDQPPSADSYLGAWIIGGSEFLADQNTKFEEERGLLVKGAFVEVEYFIQNGQRVIHELKTTVPPGAGDDDRIGRIQEVGDDNGIDPVRAAAQTWMVGGVAYQLTPATMLAEQKGSLEVGAGAIVNSFVDANGAHVATSIEGIGALNELFLPATNR